MKNTEPLGYKEFKCNKCGWVHAALPLAAVQVEVEASGYSKCFRCGAPSAGFVPAQEGDVHRGATIQGVYVPGAWDDFFINGPSVSEDFDRTNMRGTERIFEHYPLVGDYVCIGIFCKRCGQTRLFKK